MSFNEISSKDVAFDDIKSDKKSRIYSLFRGYIVGKTIGVQIDPLSLLRVKYFIGCKDDKKIRPLFIFLQKLSTCTNDFDETKYISFFNNRWWNIKKNVMNIGKKLKIV